MFIVGGTNWLKSSKPDRSNFELLADRQPWTAACDAGIRSQRALELLRAHTLLQILSMIPLPRPGCPWLVVKAWCVQQLSHSAHVLTLVQHSQPHGFLESQRAGYVLLAVLTGLAFFTRFYKIGHPTEVVYVARVQRAIPAPIPSLPRI